MSDLKYSALISLPWDDPNVNASLESVVKRALEEADRTGQWYLVAKQPKRVVARLLRSGAILLTAAAGILPILQQIYSTPAGLPPFSPAWASVLLALAVLFVAVDRFFGFSSAWIRFIVASMQVKKLRDAFEQDWLAAQASFRGQTPTPEQVATVLGSTKTFTDQLNALVAEETSRWVAEFQEALKQIDEASRAAAQPAATGSLTITVTNGDQVDPPGWSLAIGNAAPATYTGKSAAITGLLAQDHRIGVSGTIAQKKVRAEGVAAVRAGPVTALSVTLS